MEKMDFYVYLSPKEAAEKVKEAVTAGSFSGEILDEYVRILPNGKEIIMVLFEKYYMRAGNRATLTFLADNLEEHTRVHLSAGGDADAQTGKRTGAAADSVVVDLRGSDAGVLQQTLSHWQQRNAVGLRHIQKFLAEKLPVPQKSGGSCGSRAFQ